jgi:hypothetical protein
MKPIQLRAKPEIQKQLNLRVPASLKALVETNRQLANECGIDYNATAVDFFTKWNTDLHTQLRDSRSRLANHVPTDSSSTSAAESNSLLDNRRG